MAGRGMVSLRCSSRWHGGARGCHAIACRCHGGPVFDSRDGMACHCAVLTPPVFDSYDVMAISPGAGAHTPRCPMRLPLRPRKNPHSSSSSAGSSRKGGAAPGLLMDGAGASPPPVISDAGRPTPW